MILKKQIRRFIFSGISAVSTDLIVYFTLINFFSYNLSKSVSFVSGTLISYLLNKLWTFEVKGYSHSEIINFSILYSISFFVNVILNDYLINNFNNLYLAFFIATATSALINFIGQKFWVFNK